MGRTHYFLGEEEMRKKVLVGLGFALAVVLVALAILIPFDDGCWSETARVGEPSRGWTRDLVPRGNWETVLGRGAFYVVEKYDRYHHLPTIAFPMPGGTVVSNSDRFVHESSLACQNFLTALRRSIRTTFRVDKTFVYDPQDYGLPYELFAYR